MKTDTQLQRFKTLLIEGLKITTIPAVLILSVVGAIVAVIISSSEPSWEYPTSLDVVFLAVYFVIPFILATLFGIVVISFVLGFRHQKLTDISAGFVGVIVGIIMVIGAYLILFLVNTLPYLIFDFEIGKALFFVLQNLIEFLLSILWVSAPLSLTVIFICVYVTRRLNRASTPETAIDIPDDLRSEVRIELRGAWLGAQVASIGCVVFIGIQAIYKIIFPGYGELLNVILEAVLYLGFALVLTLPLALVGGFILGSIVKRVHPKVSLTKRGLAFIGGLVGIVIVMGGVIIADYIYGGYVLEPLFQGHIILGLMISAAAGAVAGNRLLSSDYDGRIIHLKEGEKWFRIIKKIAVVLLLVYGAVLGIIYLSLTIPSEREIWRNTEYYIFDPMVINNLFLFEGSKIKDQYVCDYIYALDKTTGEMVWSTETITKRYCSYEVNIGSLRHTIIGASETGDVIFIGLRDWKPREDNDGYKLYAIRGADGEMLWEVDGYASDSLLEYSIAETDAIYIINEEGYFAAIDSKTGHQIWKQEVPKMDCWEDEIIIGYDDQIVYYYDSGNQLLIAFDAITGNPVWQMTPQTSIAEIMVSDKLVYLVTFSSEETKEDLYYVTALDIEMGEDEWELFFEQAYPVTNIFGNEIFVLTSEWQGEPENNHWLGVLDVVNKTTGELLWQFTGDSSNGHNHKVIDYLVEGDTVYVSTEGGVIFALENETGEVIWQTKTSGFPFYFVVEDDTLVAVYEEEYIVALDTKTGSQKWSADIGVEDTNTFREYEPIEVDNGIVYIPGSLEQKIFAIDLETGKEIWSWYHNHPNDSRYYLKAVDGNAIYVKQSLDTIFGRHWFFALKTEP